ncbi:oxidative stress-induced growth inhibitor 1 [Anabrus simplex]|uniref:oxidative stress-induced growth inhibitor 1 n=1 Tax=Anabrus simplex TaxID=316456 RepID=UPI0035A3520A
MRDFSAPNSVPEDAVYKEVVVVGNGPSGIAVSHLLAGHWPYYNGEPHPDELLTARLRAAPPSRSLLEQDLHFLSQGLEGRCNNPVSLLLDALTHPCADLGLELPSLLEWIHHPERLVEHVVLGKGPPGGAWQEMDGNVLTISLGSWMELPGLDFRTWETWDGGQASSRNSRALVSSVARYYEDYVEARGLSRFFRNGSVVTSVRPLNMGNTVDKKITDPETGVETCSPPVLWCVEGYDTANCNAPFCYVSRCVVLATGSIDLPNRLQVPGEMDNPEWVLHDLRTLEIKLDELVDRHGKDREGMPTEPDCDPVLIVGAGLSAADAIIAARFRSLPILHLFRRRHNTLDKQLPENMYPEYHKVYQMMSDGGENYSCYTALPEHKILEITPDHIVYIESPDGKVVSRTVSAAAILIGSRPDLSFLHLGGDLGVVPSQPIDCRSNPVDVDLFTYAVKRAPSGLYALGPLAGDNFVRFIQGGAVAIASNIHKERKHHTVL